jgi:hypothetical protein
METINWLEKSIDEIYEYHSNIEDDNDAVKFLIHLLKNCPQLELAWIDMLADTMYPLFEKGDFDEVLNFVEIYQQIFPEDYKNEYEFVEEQFISQYLFRNDIENVKKRIEVIKQNPVQGHDIVTIKALFQLIYHGYYDLALEYSQAVWKPMFETEELLGSPHYQFSTTIYLHELDNIYQRVKSGEQPDILLFKKQMDEYDLDEDVEMYQKVFYELSHPLNKELIVSKITNKESDVLLLLNIQFLKYMKEKYNIPFMLSDRLWNMLTAFDLFGSENSPEGFFYIPYIILEDHFNEQSDLFMTNEVEMFGKVWGLNYAYTFLHESSIISDQYFSLMEENIHALKDEYIKQAYTSLWEMNFVYKWPQIYLPDPYEKELFDDTHKQNDQKVKEKLDNYIALMTISGRINKEIDSDGTRKRHKYLFPEDQEDDFEQIETYVREEPKTGRNDPCPCGSGKKYKKCCMNK